MNNDIPAHVPGGQGQVMAHAVDACVHCGFCLPACPTYALLGDEMDSPRGRIILMKEVLEGGLPLMDAAPHLDRCLGCMGCVTACPSGVPYGELITAFRGWSEPRRNRSPLDRAKRYAILKALPAPKLFSVAARVGQYAKPLAPVLPDMLRSPLDLLPEHVPAMQPSPALTPARGQRRGRVAFLVGCAQQALTPNFNAATLRVLARNGIEVVVPDGQGCCGAAALHTGARGEALKLVRANLEAFDPDDYDAILSNAAGCGAGLKEYPMVLRGEPDEARAHAFAAKVMDISEYLNGLLLDGTLEPMVPTSRPLNVAYHDACHLAHAQGVKAAPRALLRAIPGVTVLEVPEGDLCCGSAGTYNLEQPELATQLGQRKAKNILSTTPDVIASGNIGCHTQIQSHVRRQRSAVPVMHTIEVLDLAYRGEL
ncbi:glycolate oxidase iron-sulfur subunit [Deinococcus metalli]|uniref:Glycolate oxidase iron-sulfur subunit n=1 Tax=Deinococcus metalli TaxID=1141878 RepID=A0A7W8KJP5_9DEIO|nr:glycolate oxidase subunit GlcF [Deinococcus metalli]MBB5378211.1 glycolate oxidase iron-sulfur subunit [Deinococcus metalli]GHF56858.1 glycolate oxidase iron-sulfur subunit [Deinococcus metalli]